MNLKHLLIHKQMLFKLLFQRFLFLFVYTKVLLLFFFHLSVIFASILAHILLNQLPIDPLPNAIWTIQHLLTLILYYLIVKLYRLLPSVHLINVLEFEKFLVHFFDFVLSGFWVDLLYLNVYYFIFFTWFPFIHILRIRISIEWRFSVLTNMLSSW